LHSLPEIDEFNTLGIPETIKTTKKIVNEWLTVRNKIPRTSFVFCIDDINTNQFIGLIALNLGKLNFRTASVWYKIHVNFWRKGYATEALIKILNFGFSDLNLHRIEAGCVVENIASRKVLEKASMIKEGSKRKIYLSGENGKTVFYAILEEDFFKLNNVTG
jgi:ribosomal-protein-alanine N-acetyltransferase